MTEKRELNLEELEKVSGGIKTVDGIQLYELADFINFKKGTKVSIYSGSYSGNSFTYLCEGVITEVSAGGKGWAVKVQVSNNPSIKNVTFTSMRYAEINGKTADCWFGPKQ